MAKLNPPSIEGIIPALKKNNDGITIVVPFFVNRSVGVSQISGFSLKVKTSQSTSYLFDLRQTDSLYYNLEDSPFVKFFISSADANFTKLKLGQFYKLQLAYMQQIGVDKENKPIYEVGSYSSIGVAKVTSEPEIAIRDLGGPGAINNHIYNYVGTYSQKGKDTTERVYSYRFKMVNDKGVVIADSGDQLHNSENDVDYWESYDEFAITQDLELNKSYYITYSVKTINGLEVSSPRYRIMQRVSIDPEIKADLQVGLDFENGYIGIELVGHKDPESGLEEPVTGAFLLTRAEVGTNAWKEISRFKLTAQNPTSFLWKDMTIEQGKNYVYSLQQYNDFGLYSNRLLSNEVYADFEHSFLYDGERQLKIKYNPKVSSFKSNIPEQKIDTIGSKHPFIFRNGKVNYKEFPISGLISYYSDEDNLFIFEDELDLSEKTTNLIGQNIYKERIFKTRVQEWLTNGKPKLFRSPNEGNFIVRLMNCSLAPMDQLGRMLHTFNCTAYEVAEFNYENLNEYSFIQLNDPEVPTIKWMTVNFAIGDGQGGVTYIGEDGSYINKFHAKTVRFNDMAPGSIIELTFANNVVETILIGVTGSYYVDSAVDIVGISFPTGSRYQGNMVYSYYSTSLNRFNTVNNVEITEAPVHQFIGEHDVLRDIEQIEINGVYKDNPKVDIVEIYVIAAQKRTIQRAFMVEGKGLCADEYGNVSVVEDPFILYAVGHWDYPIQNIDIWTLEGENLIRYGYRPGYTGRVFVVDEMYDPTTGKTFKPEKYNPDIELNGNRISIRETEYFDLRRPGKVSSLECGNGATIEISYQLRNINYIIEEDETYPELVAYKKAYLGRIQEYNRIMSEIDKAETQERLEFLFQELETTKEEREYYYNIYIKELIKAQEHQAMIEEEL